MQKRNRALQANVLLLNEIGLDPGIDHCSAISLIDNLKAQGREIVSFTSFCGGLPAPNSIFDDASSQPVPLRYKFSWSPVGVLRAANQGVRYLLNGRVSATVLLIGVLNHNTSDVRSFNSLERTCYFRDSLEYPIH